VPEAEAKTKTGEPCNFLISRELALAIRAFQASQRPKPTKTSLFITAMEMFLEDKGYWPPEKES